MIDRNHPAVLAALNAETQRQRKRVDAYADDHVREMRAALTAAQEHYTADDLRDHPAGRALMAETWKKFQEHYAAKWEEAYPEDIFPSPAPPPAVVSRESVAASMMRHWAENLRTDRNPYDETPND